MLAEAPPISITRIRLEVSASVQLPHRLSRELVAAVARGLITIQRVKLTRRMDRERFGERYNE